MQKLNYQALRSNNGSQKLIMTQTTNIDWMAHYYFLNNFWVYYNIVGMWPFVIGCINRYRNPGIEIHLFTDDLTRIVLIVSCIFYIYESVVKYFVDGGETICQKAVFIHHVVSQFIILPVILNRYIPWWANPIGFLHGILVFFPDFEILNYVYAFAILYFQYRLYQKPFDEFPYYTSSRIAVNGVWVFAIYLMIGDCSNFLPLGPD